VLRRRPIARVSLLIESVQLTVGSIRIPGILAGYRRATYRPIVGHYNSLRRKK
jgi:hypothetical protein